VGSALTSDPNANVLGFNVRMPVIVEGLSLVPTQSWPDPSVVSVSGIVFAVVVVPWFVSSPGVNPNSIKSCE
jgi:hypothetical protein